MGIIMWKKVTVSFKNLNWKGIFERASKLFKWGWSYFDWGLFLLLIMFKLYLFASYTNTVFYSTGALGFFKDIYRFLFKGQSFNFLRHDLVLISFGFLLLFTFWTLLLKRRKRLVTLLILNFIFTFIIFADLIHFRYFGGYTSVAELIQIDQVGDVGGSILSLVEWKDFLFWIDILLLIPLTVWVLRKVEFQNNKRKILAALTALFIGWFSISQSLFTFYYDYGGKGILNKMISGETVYKYVGLLGYHYFDARRYTKDYIVNKKGISDERKKEIDQWFKARQSGEVSDSFGAMEGKNLIIVQVEALQDFVLDRTINDEEITPFLNDLKDKSLYFENFYHQAGQGRTSDADLLVNTSLHPLASGSVFSRYSGNKYNTISSILEKKGYGTSVHHAFKASFWNRNNVYSSWGYDNFYSQKDYKEGENIGWGLGDEGFLTQSVDLMPKEQPFYSFLITLTSHHPYNMPGKYQTLNMEAIQDPLLQNYLHSIHYVDGAVEKFVEKLKAEGLWEESIVAFYGDHDAKVLEEGKESGNFATEHNRETVDFLREKDKIPLLIHMPDDYMAGTNSTFGGQIDLAPTLLHLLGVKTDKQYFIGTDLLLNENHPVVFHDGSVTDGNVWYVPSEDAVFQNGICYDANGKHILDVDECREVKNEAMKEIDVSEDIILGNLLKGLK
jgi:lipoteichoic acid synthase